MKTGDASVKDSFGPNGGTVRIYNYIRYTRIDIERLDPMLNISSGQSLIDSFYQAYYANSVFKKIRSSYDTAEILTTRKDKINGIDIFFATAIVSGDRPYRSSVLYTDGEYIYTFTTLDIKREYLNWDEDKQLQNAFLVAKSSFEDCRFKR